ncbi:hypothetical protein [Glutamicibacter sp. Je.9.36]|uniref:hypothetical protein n=1 Tax=Glutamicibacter sp. Je.9.36 TaxID=3142837 RepID=UPI003DA7D34A
MNIPKKYPSWNDVVHAVRRYRPSDFLPALALAAYSLQGKPFSSMRKYYNQWAIAALARESILYGTEDRDREVTVQAINRTLFTFDQADFSQGIKGKPLYLAMGSFLYEQYKFQLSSEHEIARTYLLFCDPELQVDRSKAPDRDWSQVFDMPLEERLESIRLIEAATFLHHGIIPIVELEALGRQPEADQNVVKNMMRTVEDLTATIQEARDSAKNVPLVPDYLKRFSFNPLERFPIINIGKSSLLVPQPFYLLRTLSVGNLFYRGCEVFGSAFPSELGYRVEAYVGMQLGYAEFDHVLPEIDYGTTSPKLSVDWFAMAGDTVLLIECKSAKLSQHVLSGEPSKTEDLLKRSVGKAREQIKNTSELINGGHEKFNKIPSNMNQIGLIVTAEPIYCANDSNFHEGLTNPNIPCLSISLDDLESLAALGAGRMVEVLSAVLDGPNRETWNVRDTIRQHFSKEESLPKNLLDDAYKRFQAARGQKLINS